MARVTWKRTRNGIEFVEKKSFSERIQDVTFMETAIFLFVLAVIFVLGGLIWATASGGNAGWPVILIGLIAIALGIAGILVTAYGHFSVGAESRLDWKVGIYTNGAVVLLMLIFYILGAVFG